MSDASTDLLDILLFGAGAAINTRIYVGLENADAAAAIDTGDRYEEKSTLAFVLR